MTGKVEEDEQAGRLVKLTLEVSGGMATVRLQKSTWVQEKEDHEELRPNGNETRDYIYVCS